jgi:hypothetical protein
VQGTQGIRVGSIQVGDLPIAGFEFVPDGGKLARKGIRPIMLLIERPHLLDQCRGGLHGFL